MVAVPGAVLRPHALRGGPGEYVDDVAAVLIDDHGRHVINVFTWATPQRMRPQNSTRNGYHVACWTVGNLESCAVSDTSREELQGLVRLLQNLPE